MLNAAACRLRLRGLVAGTLVAAGAAAHAGLFDDEEARRAILDMRARIQAGDEASRARTAELARTHAQLLEQLQQLRASLLDLNGQLESQRAELARLRGTQEQLARDVAEVQRRQKDVAQGVDERLRKLEPQAATIDGKEILVEPDERRLHDEAMATLRSGDFNKAASQLSAFLRRYPTSGYALTARFWLGNALYGKKDYREAIAIFRSFVTEAPDHPRAPEALLSLANSQLEMKDAKGARRTLEEVVKSYPTSEAAVAAKERMGSIKG
jgi:tol-pal system protein YbgF